MHGVYFKTVWWQRSAGLPHVNISGYGVICVDWMDYEYHHRISREEGRALSWGGYVQTHYHSRETL